MCQRMRLPKLPDLAFFCLSFAAFNLLPVNGRLSSHPNSTAASRCAGKSSPFSDASSSPGSTSDSSTWECCMLHKCLYFRPDPTAGAVCTLRFERVNQSLLLSVGLMPVATVAQPEQLSAACVTVRALGFGPMIGPLSNTPKRPMKATQQNCMRIYCAKSAKTSRKGNKMAHYMCTRLCRLTLALRVV